MAICSVIGSLHLRAGLRHTFKIYILEIRRTPHAFLYLHGVVCSLGGHVGGLLCLFDVVDDFVISLSYVHESFFLCLFDQTVKKTITS